MPPSIKGEELDSYIYDLVDLVDRIRIKYEDAMIFLGGDFNKKDMGRFCTAFPDILPIKAGATRRGFDLDEVYSNLTEGIIKKAIQHPLSKPNGILSDHSVITASIALPKQGRIVSTKFRFRPITAEGTDKFRVLLNEYDWDLNETC